MANVPPMPERGERWAVFLDVDGTLVAIAATTEAARPVPDLTPREALDRVRPRLVEAAAARPGLRLEDKGGSLALHYRLVPEQGPTLHRLARSIAATEPELRVIDGRKVVELQ